MCDLGLCPYLLFFLGDKNNSLIIINSKCITTLAICGNSAMIYLRAGNLGNGKTIFTIRNVLSTKRARFPMLKINSDLKFTMMGKRLIVTLKLPQRLPKTSIRIFLLKLGLLTMRISLDGSMFSFTSQPIKIKAHLPCTSPINEIRNLFDNVDYFSGAAMSDKQSFPNWRQSYLFGSISMVFLKCWTICSTFVWTWKKIQGM